MNVVVVYDSVFGNTRVIAQAVADGALSAATGPVRCAAIGTVDPDEVRSADLLVVGGPTHMLGLSSRRSRETYLRPQDVAAGRSRSGHVLEPGNGEGLREWLAGLPHASPAGPPGAAAFDTRLNRVFAGSAARAVHRRLRRLGYRMVAPAQSFFVEAMEGPLPPGQVERARRWGAALAEAQAVAARNARAGAVTTRRSMQRPRADERS